jgi:hypothetical protein
MKTQKMILGRNTNKLFDEISDIAAIAKLQKSTILCLQSITHLQQIYICKDRLTWVPMSSCTRLQNILAGHSDVIAGALIAS